MCNESPEQRLRLATVILRISIGIIYLWFGGLKFFPGLSPAEDLAEKTINLLTLGLIHSRLSLFLLAIWETLAGVLLITGLFKRITFAIVLSHMALTFTPPNFVTSTFFCPSPLCPFPRWSVHRKKFSNCQCPDGNYRFSE